MVDSLRPNTWTSTDAAGLPILPGLLRYDEVALGEIRHAVRLKANIDISGFSRDNQVILRALQRYGMVLADNGSSWFLMGSPDSRWNDDDLHKLQQVTGSNFEAVDVSDWELVPSSARTDPTVGS